MWMKRIRTGLLFALLAGMAGTLLSCKGTPASSDPILFYVGSSGSQDYSIFLCSLDLEAQSFAVVDSFTGAAGASYLAPSPGFDKLFAMNQASFDPGSGHSSVSSFEINPESFALSFINSQSSEGNGICHIHCSRDGRYIFAANYGSGHASAFPVDENGRIGPATAVVIGSGSGPVEDRQEGPHAHMAMLDPSQNFLLVPDLGTDKIMIYAFDPASGSLSPNPAQAFFSLAAGAGPRHLAFHPDRNWVYVVNELNSTLTACRWDPSEGTLTEINTLSTVEDSHEGMKYPAAVRVHPNGRYVYASTRGENSCISVFRIGEDGSAERIQVMEQVPLWPRDFNLDPTGHFLIAAGERSGTIRLYHIDPENGTLGETGTSLDLPAPANILFIP
jgi:6-phosphogluconolactonase